MKAFTKMYKWKKKHKTKTKYQTTCINKLHIKIWTCYKSFVKDYHKAYTYVSKYPLKANKRLTVHNLNFTVKSC